MLHARIRNTAAWFMLVMMAVIVSTAVAYASSAGGQGVRDIREMNETAHEDMLWLASMMEELSDGPIGVTATNMGMLEATDGRQLDEIAYALLTDLPGSSYRTVDRAVIGSAQLSEATVLSISVQDDAEHQVLVVARLQSHRMDDLSSYEEWFRSIDHLWAEQGWQTDGWRINLQAALKQDRKAEELWDALQRAGAERSSSDAGYRDERTESRTFDVPKLHGRVYIGGYDEVNLQAAWHRSTEDDSYRITLGTPLITIEY